MARGDHIFVSRKQGIYTHHGIDCGDGTVIHFTGEPGMRKAGASVARTQIEEFAARSEIKTRQHRKHFAPDDVVTRAESQLDAKGYNFAFNNCEHFAHWCCTGVNKSSQVRNAVAGLGAIPVPLAAPAAALGAATLGIFLASRKVRGTERRQ